MIYKKHTLTIHKLIQLSSAPKKCYVSKTNLKQIQSKQQTQKIKCIDILYA